MNRTLTTRALCAIALLCSAIQAQAEPARSGWFLGACIGTPPERRHCRLLSEQPLPDQAVCNAMRDSLIRNGYPGRVLCAPVLVDDD